MHEMFASFQQAIESFHQGGFQGLGPWSYLLIALLVATEGPVTTLIGATAAATGFLDIRLVFVATAIGNIAGDALWYSVGYAGKSKRLQGLTSRLGLHREQVLRLEDGMRTHAAKAILIAKITFGLIIPTLVAAGLARVPLRRWFPAVLVAETIWTILLVSIGFHAAGAIAQVESGFRMIGLIAAIIVITVALIHLKRSKRNVPLNAAPKQSVDQSSSPCSRSSSRSSSQLVERAVISAIAPLLHTY